MNTTTETATAAQISYITKLREDKSWRYEKNFHLTAGPHMEAETAGRAAFEASEDAASITKAGASTIIDALKAW